MHLIRYATGLSFSTLSFPSVVKISNASAPTCGLAHRKRDGGNGIVHSWSHVLIKRLARVSGRHITRFGRGNCHSQGGYNPSACDLVGEVFCTLGEHCVVSLNGTSMRTFNGLKLVHKSHSCETALDTRSEREGGWS